MPFLAMINWSKLIMPILAIGLIIGSYFIGHHIGYKAAQDAQWQAAYNQLTDQIKAGDKALKVFHITLDGNHVVIETIKQEIVKHVKDNRACDIDSVTIGLLNSARAGQLPPAH